MCIRDRFGAERDRPLNTLYRSDLLRAAEWVPVAGLADVPPKSTAHHRLLHAVGLGHAAALGRRAGTHPPRVLRRGSQKPQGYATEGL